ncbi:L-lactate dehydrogenase [uncultured Oscillibacter sp.]|uniref:L-lactate dehydrogenase n=1 Tax=uncultured Oscillibacter sp. TaxID=876091 RepID=UPI0026324F4A|nr:L-lactate dehydrogenase [uncultured Oscillibacter sp.]
MKIDHRKAAVIGCGNVGASIAFRFLQQGLFTRLVLLDANRDKAEGEAMDLRDGLPYGAAMEISAGDYDDLRDCALAVITAGANQKPGETRLDLIGKNTEILRSVLKEVTARNFGGILLVVSNPVDVLTYAAWRLSGYPRERVMGSGTVLDTGRLKQLLGAELEVDSRNIHAFIIGEHGDSELAVWSEANVSGLDLEDFCRVRGQTLGAENRERLYREVRDSAYQIIERKGATYYGIAMAVGRIAEAIVKDERAVLPVSAVLDGQYGMNGLALSLPSIVGRKGLQEILEMPLSSGERAALSTSAEQMREAIESLKL